MTPELFFEEEQKRRSAQYVFNCKCCLDRVTTKLSRANSKNGKVVIRLDRYSRNEDDFERNVLETTLNCLRDKGWHAKASRKLSLGGPHPHFYTKITLTTTKYYRTKPRPDYLKIGLVLFFLIKIVLWLLHVNANNSNHTTQKPALLQNNPTSTIIAGTKS